jgi:hypothetical protein
LRSVVEVEVRLAVKVFPVKFAKPLKMLEPVNCELLTVALSMLVPAKVPPTKLEASMRVPLR